MTLSKIDLLTALNIPRVGRKTILKVVGRSTSSLGERSSTEFMQSVASLVRFDDSTENLARNMAIRQIEEAEEIGVSIVTVLDSCYPSRLRTIEDMPVLLFVRGSIECAERQTSIAIIGTRDPSAFAQRAARSSARLAAESGALVVSGLAKGCDTLAHIGCLEGRGQTIAVLAHGLDKIYPSENRQLACQIVEEGGALLSEYPVGAPVHRSSFVERDRLQSGLSDCVLVIETSESGGTMHTVRFAHSQGRTLATVNHPSSFDRDDRVGGNRLLRDRYDGLTVRDRESLQALIDSPKQTFAERQHLTASLESDCPTRQRSDDPLQGSLFGDENAQ